MGIVALGQVKSDDPVLIAGDDLAMSTGAQVECKTVGVVPDLDRKLELIQPKDQPALSRLRDPILSKSDSVGVRGPRTGQSAAETQSRWRVGICDPIASATVEVGTDRAIGGDSHHGALRA